MGEFFNMDNKFFQGLGKLVDCVCLSVIWLVFCIPIFTAGAATTALYYTVNKVIRNSRGYIWKEFWSSFKSNFKQSTIVWLILMLIYVIMSMDLYIMYQYAKAGATIGNFYMVFVVLMALVTMWAGYVFPYMARFENTTKQVLKNTVLIAIGNLQWSFLLLILILVAVVALLYFPPVIFVVPVFYMVFANLILERVFKKYMSQEDLEAEEERNREYFN